MYPDQFEAILESPVVIAAAGDVELAGADAYRQFVLPGGRVFAAPTAARAVAAAVVEIVPGVVAEPAGTDAAGQVAGLVGPVLFPVLRIRRLCRWRPLVC